MHKRQILIESSQASGVLLPPLYGLILSANNLNSSKNDISFIIGVTNLWKATGLFLQCNVLLQCKCANVYTLLPRCFNYGHTQPIVSFLLINSYKCVHCLPMEFHIRMRGSHDAVA